MTAKAEAPAHEPARLDAAIAEFKAHLIRWIVGVSILQTTIIVGVLLMVAKLIWPERNIP